MLKKVNITLTFLFHAFIFFFLFLITKNNFFFWDKDINDSVQAHWLLENNFNYLIPDSIDPGHPPFVPTILALLWLLFGKKLIIGHLFMFFMTLGAIWQILNFVRFFISKHNLFLASLLILLDATFMSQSVLVSSDIILVFFFFLAINSILRNKKGWLIIGLSGLCIINMRGLMSGAVVFIFHIYYYYHNNTPLRFKTLSRLFVIYAIPLILPIIYYTWHFQEKSWIGYHSESPWAGSYNPSDFKDFLRNIVILGWRLVDFGRIFLWLFTVSILIIKGKQIFKKRNPVFLLAALFISSILVYGFPMLVYEFLSGHRYLLPSYIVFATLTSYLLFNYIKKYRSLIYTTLVIGILSGNLWIYPEKIAQGWDSTLAHLPYYDLKDRFLEYLWDESINVEEVGAVTPNKSALKYVHLNENTKAFAPLNFKKNKYIFYSNIMNDYSDREIDILYQEWVLKKSFNKNGIFIKLFKNPKYE